MFKTLIEFFTNPLADIVGGWQGRKTIAAETAAMEAENDAEIKKAIAHAKIQRITSQDNADAAYDLLALENRRYSIMDNILMFFWLTIVAMHFVPVTQPMMLKGWIAIDKAPWWFQFGMIGILVSTLGLMRLLRMLLEKKFSLRGG